MSGYRDFIPEGEDTGGAGSGFKDFIPAPEEVVVGEKGESVFSCDQCSFTTTKKIGLIGHMKKHSK